MLDRAVTLSIRYFVPLALIWVVYIVPLMVFQFYGTADMSKFFNDFITVFSAAKTPAAQRAALDAMSARSVFNGFSIGYFALLLLISPLAGAALKRSCSRVYLAEDPQPVAPAYRAALKQWLPLLGIALIWIGLGAVAYVGFALVGIVAGLAVMLLFYINKFVGIAAGSILATILVVVLVGAVVLALLAMQVGFYTQVIENLGFIRSMWAGITRVFGANFRRALAVGFALGAVDIGFSIVAIVGQGLLFGLARSHILGTAFSALLAIAAAIFVDMFTVIYYYDIRVRREGFDLQLEAASQTSAAPAPA
jgi:hypothetical protein